MVAFGAQYPRSSNVVKEIRQKEKKKTRADNGERERENQAGVNLPVQHSA